MDLQYECGEKKKREEKKCGFAISRRKKGKKEGKTRESTFPGLKWSIFIWHVFTLRRLRTAERAREGGGDGGRVEM